MVLSFLEKYREELTAETMELKEDYDLILSRIRENEKFLQMMKDEEKVYVTGFSPRETVNGNEEKIKEVETALSSLYDKRDTLDGKIKKLEERLSELQQAIAEVHIENDLSFSLKTICQYILSDPYRAKTELENILQKIQTH